MAKVRIVATDTTLRVRADGKRVFDDGTLGYVTGSELADMLREFGFEVDYRYIESDAKITEYQCPNCGNMADLEVQVSGYVRLIQNADEPAYPLMDNVEECLEWNEEGPMRCGMCNHSGAAEEFTQGPPELCTCGRKFHECIARDNAGTRDVHGDRLCECGRKWNDCATRDNEDADHGDR